MGILEIILIGYGVNLLFSFINFIIMFLYVIISGLINPKTFNIVTKLHNKFNTIREIKKQLKAQNKSTLTQESFIFFIPYSSVLVTLITLYNIFTNNFYIYAYERTQVIQNKLLDRL